MKKTNKYSRPALLIIILALVSSGAAQILSSDTTVIDFSAGKVTEGVSWSPHMSLGKTGLETKIVKAPIWQRYSWVQTQAVPVGISWRPPTSARVQLNVQYTTPPERSGRAYFRYSSDKVHWSSWYGMPKTSDSAGEGEVVYRAEITLPRSVREKYEVLMREWQKSGSEPSSDEQEFCEWLATRYPEYFTTEVPFIGYVQWRVEDAADFPKMGIAKMKMNLSWGVGGIHNPSQRMGQLGPEQKWSFDLCSFAGRCGQ